MGVFLYVCLSAENLHKHFLPLRSAQRGVLPGHSQPASMVKIGRRRGTAKAAAVAQEKNDAAWHPNMYSAGAGDGHGSRRVRARASAPAPAPACAVCGVADTAAGARAKEAGAEALLDAVKLWRGVLKEFSCHCRLTAVLGNLGDYADLAGVARTADMLSGTVSPSHPECCQGFLLFVVFTLTVEHVCGRKSGMLHKCRADYSCGCLLSCTMSWRRAGRGRGGRAVCESGPALPQAVPAARG